MWSAGYGARVQGSETFRFQDAWNHDGGPWGRAWTYEPVKRGMD